MKKYKIIKNVISKEGKILREYYTIEKRFLLFFWFTTSDGDIDLEFESYEIALTLIDEWENPIKEKHEKTVVKSL